MWKIGIIGQGPAGISAAIYIQRAGINAVAFGKGGGALAYAESIENYYGFPEPISGAELMKLGRMQAARLGAEMIDEEVVGFNFDEKLVIKTTAREEKFDAVIIATGVTRARPKIEGAREFEGRGVSYCAVCDGFFHRGRDVVVIGAGEYALSEALELKPLVSSVTVLTNGAEAAAAFPDDIRVNHIRISKIAGGENDRVTAVHFADGSELPVSGVFIAMGAAGSGDLAKKLGAETRGNDIVVNTDMSTAIPGLYAAGDCTGGMLQIVKAAYEGAMAGTSAVKYVRGHT